MQKKKPLFFLLSDVRAGKGMPHVEPVPVAPITPAVDFGPRFLMKRSSGSIASGHNFGDVDLRQAAPARTDRSSTPGAMAFAE